MSPPGRWWPAIPPGRSATETFGPIRLMINNISVLVLTLNEAVNLPGCLQSVDWCDDIAVFDSFSSDETLNSAQQHGARVLRRHFDNYANQRDAGLQTYKFKHCWV